MILLKLLGMSEGEPCVLKNSQFTFDTAAII